MSLALLIVRRLGCIDALMRPPLVELILWQSNNVERHARMLQPAEFRALPAINARALRDKRQLVLAARDEILLARERGHPKGMDDVRARQGETYRSSDRHDDFICGGKR